jgi:L-ascorbate metabolism protein UlaG (beta-lactamase superfamily)
MQITWYGHSAFRLDFAGHSVLFDPSSHIVLTHGHADHVGDTLDIAKSNGATVTAT